MALKKNSDSIDKIAVQISRQLELIMKLLAVFATEKDFASYKQEHQVALLGKMGFRNIEVAKLFNIKPQNVNKAFKKYKVKKD